MKNAHLFPTHPSSFILAIFIRIVFFCLLIGKANSQILVNNGNGIGEYTAYGIPINTALVNGLSDPQGIAISGTNLFVVDNGTATIGEYTLSGSVVTNRLIFGLSAPEGIAISGTNIFVANLSVQQGEYGNIGEYTVSGAIINTNLIQIFLFHPLCIAISGTNLFISSQGGGISKCTIYGAVLNGSFGYGYFLAVSGTNLFVANTRIIQQYNTSGVLLSSNLIEVTTNVGTINGIAVSGNNLYVLTLTTLTSKISRAVVGEYTISGATNNPSLFTVENTNGYAQFGIAVMPQSFSSTPTALAANISSTNLNLSWSTNGSEYLLECSPLFGLANWTTITNQPVVTNGNYLITLPTPNQSQFFRLHSIDN